MHPLASGLIGAAALTAIHETGRRVLEGPPRMDVVGMRGISRLYQMTGQEPPRPDALFAITMAGDLVSNAIYYSAIRGESRKAVWGKAIALGVGAGLGAVYLPEPMGLGTPPNNERLRTRWLTMGYYLAGALIAAAAAKPSTPAGTRTN